MSLLKTFLGEWSEPSFCNFSNLCNFERTKHKEKNEDKGIVIDNSHHLKKPIRIRGKGRKNFKRHMTDLPRGLSSVPRFQDFQDFRAVTGQEPIAVMATSCRKELRNQLLKTLNQRVRGGGVTNLLSSVSNTLTSLVGDPETPAQFTLTYQTFLFEAPGITTIFPLPTNVAPANVIVIGSGAGGGGGAAGSTGTAIASSPGGGGGGGGEGQVRLFEFSTAFVSLFMVTPGIAGIGGIINPSTSGSGGKGGIGGITSININNRPNSTGTLTLVGGSGGSGGSGGGINNGGNGGQGGGGSQGGGGGGAGIGQGNSNTVGGGGGQANDVLGSNGFAGMNSTSVNPGSGGSGGGASSNNGGLLVTGTLGSGGGGGGGVDGGSGGNNVSIAGGSGSFGGGGGGGGFSTTLGSGSGGTGGTGFISITVALEESATLAITSVNPTLGISGGTALLFLGTGFNDLAQVLFNLQPAFFLVVDDTRLLVAVPAGLSLGTVTINFVTDGGATTSFSFTIGSTSVPSASCDTIGTFATSFALLAGASISNVGETFVSAGNVGTNPGSSISGFPAGVILSPGSLQVANTLASNAIADAVRLYSTLSTLTPTVSLGTTLQNVQIDSGIYSFTGDTTVGGSIVFNFDNDINSIYVFQIPGSITINANTNMTTLNVSTVAPGLNIYWACTGNITIGANCTLLGTFVTSSGSITAGANLVLNGRLFAPSSLAGTITTRTSVVNLPLGTCSSVV